MRRLFKSVAAFLLLLTLGLHWTFLQPVAWAGMIISYSRDGSFTEAVSKTFDGKHPCRVCKVIKSARAEEKQRQQKQQLKPELRMDLGLVWQGTAFDFANDCDCISAPDTDASSRSYAPPKPRPRVGSLCCFRIQNSGPCAEVLEAWRCRALFPT